MVSGLGPPFPKPRVGAEGWGLGGEAGSISCLRSGVLGHLETGEKVSQGGAPRSCHLL